MSLASFAASSRTDTGTSSAHRLHSGSPYSRVPSRIDAPSVRPWTHRPVKRRVVPCSIPPPAAPAGRGISGLTWRSASRPASFRERARIAGAGYLRRDPMALLKLRPGRDDPYPIYEQLRAARAAVATRWATGPPPATRSATGAAGPPLRGPAPRPSRPATARLSFLEHEPAGPHPAAPAGAARVQPEGGGALHRPGSRRPSSACWTGPPRRAGSTWSPRSPRRCRSR